ncbi:MAG: carboxypeptidase-like regulatory domain-containing protein [Acidobacteriia bacterium]|nr:carboxypeptidase-like regulatory domain-containing protein [Terriglobia bacterium]
MVFAVLVGAPSTLKAQFTSVIEGTVNDPSNAAIPNAEVTVENQATGIKRSVLSADTGHYRIASLPPGQVTIHVSAKGFDTAVYEDVRLESDQLADAASASAPGRLDRGECRERGSTRRKRGGQGLRTRRGKGSFATAAGWPELHDPGGAHAGRDRTAERRRPGVRAGHRRRVFGRVWRQPQRQRPACGIQQLPGG